MNVWEDGWGYRSSPPADSENPQVTRGTLNRETVTGRCANTDPSGNTPRPVERLPRRSPMLTIVASEPDDNPPRPHRDRAATCRRCGWFKWEHVERPEHCAGWLE